jgi:hypothetical protein
MAQAVKIDRLGVTTHARELSANLDIEQARMKK